MTEQTPTPPPPAPEPDPRPVPTTPPAADTGGDDTVKNLSRNLYMAKGWMKLLGVLSIIQGVLMVFSIWGIILCWLPIWIGVVLHRAAGRVEMAYLNGDRAMLQETTANLKQFFTINGVLALIYVVVMGIMMIGILMMGGLGALASLAEQ